MMDLKPCPFCGGEAKLYKNKHSTLDGRTIDTYKVLCSSCEIETFVFNTPKSAAKRWNRRAAHA